MEDGNMGLFSSFFKSSFEKWLEGASDAELSDGYEERRLEWMRHGGGDKTPEMEMIDNEMLRRSEIRWKNDPQRSKDPNYRWTDANRWDKD